MPAEPHRHTFVVLSESPDAIRDQDYTPLMPSSKKWPHSIEIANQREDQTKHGLENKGMIHRGLSMPD